MGQDRWVQSALANDNFVADLLIRLCEDQWSYPPPWMTNSSLTPQPLTWGVRRPRSKPVQPNLISPDSPMAFHASTSQSVGDGAPAPVHDAEGTRGSKAIGTTSATPAAATESSNMKITAELKDKEIALQEENHLKRDIASALLSLEEHEPGNESLKKKKAIGTTSATPAATTESNNRKTTAKLKDKEIALQEENLLKRDIASALLSLEEHEPGNESLKKKKAIGTTSATPAAATESSNMKTTAELKDKEVALQEENHLKRDIASALLSLEELEPGNESLKKKKMEVTMQVAATGGVETAVNAEKDSKQTAEKLAASAPDNVILAPAVTDDNNPSGSNSGSEIQEEKNFVVPDLNVALDESQLQ